MRALRVVSGPPPDTNLPVATVRFDRFCRGHSRWENPSGRGTVDPVPPPRDGTQHFCHQIKKGGGRSAGRSQPEGIKKAAVTRFQRSATFRGYPVRSPLSLSLSPTAVARAATPAMRNPPPLREPRGARACCKREVQGLCGPRGCDQSAPSEGGLKNPAVLDASFGLPRPTRSELLHTQAPRGRALGGAHPSSLGPRGAVKLAVHPGATLRANLEGS
jgi:hypothetical protein